MNQHFHFPIALVAAICFLGIACAEAPTGGTPEGLTPDFKGKPQPDPPITVLFNDEVGNGHQEVGWFRSDGRGIYEDGCNVKAMFNLEDAILNLLGRIKKKDQAECGEPRAIHVQFPLQAAGGSPANKAGWFRPMYFMNVDHVENVTEGDGPVAREAAFGFYGCAHGFKFVPDESTEDITVNDVLVTRTGDDTWTIASRPYPDNVAVCVPDEDNPNIEYEREYYHMDIELTVTLK